MSRTQNPTVIISPDAGTVSLQESCPSNKLLINKITRACLGLCMLCPDKSSLHSWAIEVLHHIRPLQLVAHLPVVVPGSYTCRMAQNSTVRTTNFCCCLVSARTLQINIRTFDPDMMEHYWTLQLLT